jgi:hypothetical protein
MMLLRGGKRRILILNPTSFVIANEYKRARQTLGGVGIMTELKRRYGDKYKGRNEFGPRIAHWFLQRHPEFTGVIIIAR